MSDPRLAGWKRLSSELVVDDRWLRLRKERLQRVDGVVLDPFWVVDEHSWCCLVAQRQEDGRLVLVEQYRRGSDSVTLEIPAGDIDPGESPAEAIARECLEETGHRVVGTPLALGALRPEPARNTSIGHVFYAQVSEDPSWQAPEASAGVLRRVMTVEAVQKALIAGRINHGVQAAALWRCLHEGHLQVPAGEN
jgi:8-oxo-dGTP pyrophosphatase MutT (NUDIX family)